MTLSEMLSQFLDCRSPGSALQLRKQEAHELRSNFLVVSIVGGASGHGVAIRFWHPQMASPAELRIVVNRLKSSN